MFITKAKTFAHGIHTHDYKDETNHLAIKRFPFAPLLILPLLQHKGKPAIPLVNQGQEVLRGQMIACADGLMSSPIHAPATGIIKKISLVPDTSGNMVDGIYLQPYPGATQEVAQGTGCDLETATPEQILQAIQDAGVVGLGGAVFPTHVKLHPPKDKPVDTLVINGAECEPYLTTDHRVMLEQTQDIITGAQYLLKATGAIRAIIGIEANKQDAAVQLQQTLKKTQAAESDNPVLQNISIAVVTVKYPQGAEKILIKTLLDREVAVGSHSYEVGVIGINVATTAEIGRLLPLGRGVQERVITIGGPGIINKGNYRIPIGTPLRFVLDTVGVKDNVTRIFFGGPMMGQAVPNLDVSVTKGVSGIIAFTEHEIQQTVKIYPCIHCGYCVDVCPMGLNPSTLGLLAKNQEYENMQQHYHLLNCFECGACSFICPSHIPLVQYFRIAKDRLRKNKIKTTNAA